MNNRTVISALSIIALVGLSGLGCTTIADDSTDTQQHSIRGGTPAFDYPEAALLEGAGCSATVVAPRVVLTAAHCVAGDWIQNRDTAFSVTTPFAGFQKARSVAVSVFDYPIPWDVRTFSLERSDLGLIHLDRDIVLESYPEVGSAPPKGYPAFDGEGNLVLSAEFGVIMVGRRDNERFSLDSLYKTPLLLAAPNSQFPMVYQTFGRYVDPGDSGGGVYAADPAAPRRIVGVNSAALGDTTAFFAKTHVAAHWIQAEIAAARPVVLQPPGASCESNAQCKWNVCAVAENAATGTCRSPYDAAPPLAVGD